MPSVYKMSNIAYIYIGRQTTRLYNSVFVLAKILKCDALLYRWCNSPLSNQPLQNDWLFNINAFADAQNSNIEFIISRRASSRNTHQYHITSVKNQPYRIRCICFRLFNLAGLLYAININVRF